MYLYRLLIRLFCGDWYKQEIANMLNRCMTVAAGREITLLTCIKIPDA